MKKTLLLAITLCLSAAAHADGEAKSATDWYVEDYAPLWLEAPWDKVEAIASHYAETLMSHSADGSVYTGNSLEDMAASMSEWKEESWVSSDLAALKTDLLNPTTAVFKAQWIDVYSDGSKEASCGWYLADLMDGKWMFTVFADIDCDAHGF